jgi:4-hydroxy-tetrahydrodipicolinate reductase
MKQKLRVGIFGFGRTGKIVVGEFLQAPDIDVQWVIKQTPLVETQYLHEHFTTSNKKALLLSLSDLNDDFFQSHPVDVIVDFSGQTGIYHYAQAVKQGCRVISAISQYSPQELQLIERYAQQTAVLYSPNITLGINFVMVASKLMQKIAPHADIEIVEEHFRDKREISGTARRLAQALEIDEYTHVNSIRVGGIVGKHEVIFGLPNQTIRVVHESINRAAFGQGALFACRWLFNKPRGLYTMEQIIAENIAKMSLDLAS